MFVVEQEIRLTVNSEIEKRIGAKGPKKYPGKWQMSTTLYKFSQVLILIRAKYIPLGRLRVLRNLKNASLFNFLFHLCLAQV